MPKRKVVIIIAAFAAAFIVVILSILPKLIEGDYVDVTINKVTVGSEGHTDLFFSTVSSNGTPTMTGFYAGDKYLGGSGNSSSGFPGQGITNLLGRPSSDSGGIGFDLNPNRVPIAGRFEDSPLSNRLLVHEGYKRRLHAGERLYFYDFESPDRVHGLRTSDPVREYGFFEALSSSNQ